MPAASVVMRHMLSYRLLAQGRFFTLKVFPYCILGSVKRLRTSRDRSNDSRAPLGNTEAESRIDNPLTESNLPR